MVKVITYGTFDLLHYGHIRLLERAKALGDYLIVGITSDDYDKSRGKINNQQTLIERIAAVKAVGIADEIIVEEYEGQKIDDIRRLDINVFTVGSDWAGKFDYLKEYCEVVYLPRTAGVSSSEIRAEKRKLRIGVVGTTAFQKKFIQEASFVNGVEVASVFPGGNSDLEVLQQSVSYEELLNAVDAVYILTKPENHYSDVKQALLQRKHVLCEAPLCQSRKEADELYALAAQNGLILMEAIKTAYSTAYERLILMAKSGRIGQVVSVDAVCTSLRDGIADGVPNLDGKWNSVCAWAPSALLPVFQILGTNYSRKNIYTKLIDRGKRLDAFTKVEFLYPNAVASIKVAKGAKSEGELIITGTKGYIYVPAPWWKTDYFEVRYEKAENNQRFFYQLDGEGIRYMIVVFSKSIEAKKNHSYVSESISSAIAGLIEDFNNLIDTVEI